MSYVYMPEEADVPKPSRVHMGGERSKINIMACNINQLLRQMQKKNFILFIRHFYRVCRGFRLTTKVAYI